MKTDEQSVFEMQFISKKLDEISIQLTISNQLALANNEFVPKQIREAAVRDAANKMGVQLPTDKVTLEGQFLR